jgi:uncharacterized membrane protein YidH (DUF202 family)
VIERSGLQWQRTVMAWHRTTLSSVLLGLAMLKLAINRHRPVEIAAAVWILIFAALLLRFTRQRRKGATQPVSSRRLSPQCTLLIVAGATLVGAGCIIGTAVIG